MQDSNHGIAGEAHDLVYGARAATYGHPRYDFGIIANVWTGLLQDVLREGARLDYYRVAVLMTGLKLARLVNSPLHRDSRIDTIGYMLTMERLDEPAPEELRRADAAAITDDDIENWREEDEEHDDRDDPRSWAKANPGLGSRLTVDFDPGPEQRIVQIEQQVRKLQEEYLELMSVRQASHDQQAQQLLQESQQQWERAAPEKPYGA